MNHALFLALCLFGPVHDCRQIQLNHFDYCACQWIVIDDYDRNGTTEQHATYWAWKPAGELWHGHDWLLFSAGRVFRSDQFVETWCERDPEMADRSDWPESQRFDVRPALAWSVAAMMRGE